MRTLLVFVAMAACQSLPDGAREQFAEKFSCPKDRVEARLRPELKPADVKSSGRELASPEVAADPGRLSLWKAQHQEAIDHDNDYWTTIEARGCEHTILYLCHRNSGANPGRQPIRCFDYEYPSGAARW